MYQEGSLCRLRTKFSLIQRVSPELVYGAVVRNSKPQPKKLLLRSMESRLLPTSDYGRVEFQSSKPKLAFEQKTVKNLIQCPAPVEKLFLNCTEANYCTRTE